MILMKKSKKGISKIQALKFLLDIAGCL